MPPRLQISTTPFRPTLLSIPPSPHSPRSPISPKPFVKGSARSNIINELQPGSVNCQSRGKSSTPFQPLVANDPTPPRNPIPWLWRCHICKRIYPLGATRRCLNDGHYLCSGDTHGARPASGTRRRSSNASKRYNACASEFDYKGWKRYGDWRRYVQAGRGLIEERQKVCNDHRLKENATSRGKDCSNSCDYPSECRWSRHFQAKTAFTAATMVNEQSEPHVQSVDVQMDVDDLIGIAEDRGMTSTNEDFESQTFHSDHERALHIGLEGIVDRDCPIQEHLGAESNNSPTSILARTQEEWSDKEAIFETTIRILEELNSEHPEGNGEDFTARMKEFVSFLRNDVDSINIILVRNMVQHLQIEMQSHSFHTDAGKKMKRDISLLKLLEAICNTTLEARRATKA